MEADGAPSTPLPLSVLRFTGIQSYSYTDQRKVEADVEVTEDRTRDLSLRRPRTSQLSHDCSLHAGHHQYPISNESNPGNIFGLCGLISGCVTRTVKRFSFVFFIHHCKTVIKADQMSSFYPSINVILY